MTGFAKIQDLSPQAVHAALDGGRILLVDVREPAEFAAERIHGALNFPLSSFDPAALPRADDRTVVFSCGSGKRSAMAIDRCRAARHTINAHLAGGLMAWKAAGLPTITLDVGTGAQRDPA